MKLRHHAVAVTSTVVIVSHLTVWSVLLIFVTAVRLAVPPAVGTMRRLADLIYRGAVWTDSWWLRRVLGLTWNRPDLGLERDSKVIVICNHQTWCDALILQDVITTRGPILKFLAKRELVYVPILALVLFAYDFPLLTRTARAGASDADRRERDRKSVLDGARKLLQDPAAILTFVEGTRLTDEKLAGSESTFERLLAPRVGGFAMIVDALRGTDAQVLDVTLHYTPSVSFWELIGGVDVEIFVEAEATPLAELPDDLKTWLVARWEKKDQSLVAGGTS